MAGALAGRRSWPPELLVVGFWAVVACLPFHAAYVIDLAHVLRPPSWQHWFGTDQLGRDVLARTLAGAGPILAVAPAATALAVLAGGALGLVGGYYGGATDAILAAPLEAVLALPLIVVAVMALAAVGPSAGATIAVIAFVFTPLVARTVRAATLAERRREYVALAQLRGESTAFILAREILPNVARPLLVEAVVRLGYAIFTAASLGFLGFGRSPPSPDWGLTIADTYGLMAGGAWWPTLWPALATASLVLAVQGLAERWQPAAVGLRRAARAGVADGAPAPDGALVVDDLTVAYGAAVALRRVSLRIAPGEILGVVGESGCGKSTLGLAALGALPAGASIAGAVTVAGTALDGLTPGGLRRLWARRVSYVPQDPVRALNPAMRVGTQMGEVLRLLGVPRRVRSAEAAAALTRLGIAEAAAVLRRYPGEISGGMAQRVTLAMALAKRPALLVLDEPTTGLDRENAAAALDMARRLSREAGAALLLISHDLDMVARVSDRIAVLYAGSLVEAGPADAVLARPRHPYTALLLGCRPRLAARGGVLPTIPGRLPDPAALPAGCGFAARCPRAEPACAAGPVPWAAGAHGAACLHPDMPVPAAGSAPEAARPVGAPVLEAAALACTRQGRRVLRDVSLAVCAAETVGVTGPSGSGKTTLARAVLGLAPADRGSRLRLRGEPLALALAARGPAQKRAMQAVFQNPDTALNPALPVRHMLERPLRRLAGLRGAALEARVAALAEALRLDPALLERRPGALSGGQKQRVAIAHAFAAEPAVVVCDEPTSALDLSVQAAVLNAIVAQRARTGTALLLISHDADVLAFMADRLVRLGEANSLKH